MIEQVGNIFYISREPSAAGGSREHNNAYNKLVKVVRKVVEATIKYQASDKQKSNFFREKNLGLVRELNPGPPAPEAGIIPLDQRAMLTQKTFKLLIFKDINI